MGGAVARRRVVITGLGVVAPNGIGKEAFWTNLVAGRSAVDYITTFDPSPYPCKVAAEVRDFHPEEFMPRRKPKRMGRFSQFAVAAARLAVEDAGLPAEKLRHAALCQGTAAHGISDLGEASHRNFLTRGWRQVDATVGLEYNAHAATAHIQAELTMLGPAITIASACCTGIDAISWGADQIAAGRVDVALVGASEAPISEFVLSLFAAGNYLASWNGPPAKASRPYDALRSGFVLSEGGAAVLLESLSSAVERDARVYAEVLGHASVGEASSLPPSNSYALSLREALLQAIHTSALTPEHIDYVCAHGNSIKPEDRAETSAHRAAFGHHAYRIPISSIKSMLGQPFSASGVMQTIAAALALCHSIVPPTINYDFPDPECDLDYVPNQARVVRVRHALVHSHSLGGHLAGSHSAMVLGRVT